MVAQNSDNDLTLHAIYRLAKFFQSMGIQTIASDKATPKDKNSHYVIDNSFLTPTKTKNHLPKPAETIKPTQNSNPIIALQKEIEAQKKIIYPNIAINNAKNIIKNITSLRELQTAVCDFQDCDLATTAKHSIFFTDHIEVDTDVKILILKKHPNKVENEENIIAQGEEAETLIKIQKACTNLIGNTVVCNSIFWRPPGDRQPTPIEIRICSFFIYKFLELAKPDIIITMGDLAKESFDNIRNNFPEEFIEKLEVISTIDLTQLITNTEAKKQLWTNINTSYNHINASKP